MRRNKIKKDVNSELVADAIEAKEKGITYGQLQVQRHFEMQKRKRGKKR